MGGFECVEGGTFAILCKQTSESYIRLYPGTLLLENAKSHIISSPETWKTRSLVSVTLLLLVTGH